MVDTDLLHCSVCFQSFNSSTRRPFDLGCGHCYCELCLRTSPRSFRNCPECRTRASNPHVNFTILRLLESVESSMDQPGSSGSNPPDLRQPRQPPPQQQQASPAGINSVPNSSSNNSSLYAALGSVINTLGSSTPGPVAAALPVDSNGNVNPGRQGQIAAAVLNPSALHGSFAPHQAKIAQWRTAMWVYLAPLLGFLYLLSPLDLIPDFLPLIGWLDDAMVCWYIACSVYQALKQRGAFGSQQQHQQQQ